MIPDYLKFIRFQDKRLVLFFYSVLFVVLGFYWKNNDYKVTQHDVWFISGLLSIMLFNFIYELKAWWAYSYVIGRVDVDAFTGKHCSPALIFFSRPTIISALSIFVFWLIVKCCLMLPSMIYSVICLYVLSPLYILLIFRWLRTVYIRQLLTTVSTGVRYRNLYQYLGCYILPVALINLISVSPLAANSDFSLTEGFFSARLMIAMLILCAVVLAINLIFSLLSKRYVFLGRVFLKEIDFFFSKSIPFHSLYAKPFIIRVLLLLLVVAVWIVCISSALSLLQWQIGFETYFILCFMPCLAYYFLHTYWHWHNEFMMSCDMYFRYEEFNKRNN